MVVTVTLQTLIIINMCQHLDCDRGGAVITWTIPNSPIFPRWRSTSAAVHLGWRTQVKSTKRIFTGFPTNQPYPHNPHRVFLGSIEVVLDLTQGLQYLITLQGFQLLDRGHRCDPSVYLRYCWYGWLHHIFITFADFLTISKVRKVFGICKF